MLKTVYLALAKLVQAIEHPLLSQTKQGNGLSINLMTLTVGSKLLHKVNRTVTPSPKKKPPH